MATDYFKDMLLLQWNPVVWPTHLKPIYHPWSYWSCSPLGLFWWFSSRLGVWGGRWGGEGGTPTPPIWFPFFCIRMGLGVGTNNYAELISLRHLLYFALNQNCRHLQIFGDSKIVINWFNCTSACYVHSLKNILDDALFLKSQFDQITCIHIYKKHNKTVDQRSKQTAHQPRGEWLI